MPNSPSPSTQITWWPWPAMGATIGLAVYLLHAQGRLWACACGYLALWVGDIWSAENSQQLLDPYSFTHILHGVVFFWGLVWLLPRLSLSWRLWLAIFIETTWEVVENSEFIIQRYREATLALGYNGDTIINSLADILMCGLGFWLALKLGPRRSLLLFVITEAILLLWIRDSLILNVLMLIYPIEAIKSWQVG